MIQYIEDTYLHFRKQKMKQIYDFFQENVY